MNNEFHYQRLIVAYHGCEKKVRDQVLLNQGSLKPSEKAYDWLGKGIYFLKSHIQIAVRNPACILGYFLPNYEKGNES